MKPIVAAALATIVAAAAPALAQTAPSPFKDAKDAIEYREGAMHVIGNHFGRIGAMVNNKVPFDAKVVQANAEVEALMIKLPWAAFDVPGSNTGKTEAKPEIWSQPDKFKEGARLAMDNGEKLLAASRTGDQAQIKAAFGEMAKSCKGCHDNFRKE